MSDLPAPEPSGFLTVTDDGEDCVCCNGQGQGATVCDCHATWDVCGNIFWQCQVPRNDFGLPSLAPHRIRIVLLDDYLGEIIDTVLETSDPSGDFRPSISGWYRVQVCCTDPGEGECQWTNIANTDFYIDVATPECKVSLAASIQDDNPITDLARCGTVNFFANATSDLCPSGLTELTINGVSFLTGPNLPNAAGCIPLGSSVWCGNAIPGACTPPAAPYQVVRPTTLDKVKVVASDGCVSTRICEFEIPCEWKYNAVIAGVPSFGGHEVTCDGSDPQPANWLNNNVKAGRWRQSWRAEYRMTISWGGSYVDLRCPPGSEPIATGSYYAYYEEEGEEDFLDSTPPGPKVYWPYYRRSEITGSIEATFRSVLSGSFGYTAGQINIRARTGGAFPSWGDFNLFEEALNPISDTNAGTATSINIAMRCPTTGGGFAAPLLFDGQLFMRTKFPSTVLNCQSSSSGMWTWEKIDKVDYGLYCKGFGFPPSILTSGIFAESCGTGPGVYVDASVFPAALAAVT